LSTNVEGRKEIGTGKRKKGREEKRELGRSP
jgi:hypothetical protein